MNPLKYFVFFSTFLSLAHSSCPPSFKCGNLGTLEFPLSDRPECGLFTVQNCSTGYPLIQFGAEGRWYDILGKISTNRFMIFDPYLHQHLIAHSCVGVRDVSLPPVSASSTLTVASNFTLFTCLDQSRNSTEAIAESFRNYNHTYCSPWDLYYRNPATSYVPVTDVPSGCSMVRVPVKSSRGSGDLFDLLTAEYVIEWNVSEDCYKCHHRGGKCLTNSVDAFYCDKEGNRTFQKILLIGGVTIVALTFTVIIISLSIFRNYTLLKLLGIRKSRTGKELDIELFLKGHGNLVPKRYKYSDLKKMTKSFSEILGKGGYGSVYKGKLPDGRLVAVKILNESKGNGEEFINEVASISRTSHINVVTLLGFCFEDSKRALVYDFMPNGSLEKYIQNNVLSSTEEGGLGWEKLFEIALCIARGLEYLHEGCNTRILHFDMKPHNILLDKDFNPKISDFGLAKLCPNRSSIVSMLGMRGTMGYIAPEVFCRNFGEVSYKSDVYSYGMMVLEIADGLRKVSPRETGHTSDVHFPNYVYKELGMEVGTRLDGIVNGDESEMAKRKMIIVGLWCIQIDPKDRPSMSKVVEMLEGKIESLQVPPKPFLSSPPRSGPTS